MADTPNTFDSREFFGLDRTSSEKSFESAGSPLKSQLKYPLDVDSGIFYKEAIKFEILERSGVSLGQVAGTFKEEISNEVEAAKSVKGLGTLIRNKHREINELASVSGKWAAGPRNQNLDKIEAAKAQLAALEEKREGLGGSNKSVGSVAMEVAGNSISKLQSLNAQSKPVSVRFIGSILLNMPAGVQYNEQIDWQSTDLGVVGALLKGRSGLPGAGDALKSGSIANVGRMAGGAAGGIISKMLGTGGAAGAVVGAVLGSNGAVQGAVESTFSIKSNPYKEQTFQGINFRPFEFSFTFRARSNEEMKEIRNIITAFRGYSKPSFDTIGQAGTFSYPKEFRIHFLTLDEGADDYKVNEWIPQIKTCILKGVNTNFTGSGWKTFEGGAPVDITLQLSFEETEIVTQEDVFGQTTVGQYKTDKGYF